MTVLCIITTMTIGLYNMCHCMSYMDENKREKRNYIPHKDIYIYILANTETHGSSGVGNI